MLKKIFYVIIISILIIGISTSVNATENTNKLNIIQMESENKYLENDQGFMSKAIVDSDPQKGEITIELKLANQSKEGTTQNGNYENTEIFIIIPEALKAKENAQKFSQYSEYIEKLATKIFEKNSKIKIGIIGMQGPISDTTINEDDKHEIGPNDEGKKAGTKENSKIVTNLTTDIKDIKNGLKTMNKEGTKFYNNLQSAIKLASQSFSKDVNKILISLYDTVPETAIGQCMEVTYGGSSGYKTIEEAVNAKNKKLVENTKKEILNLKNMNIDFILLRPDNKDFNQKWYNTNTGELILDFDGSKYVEELYGTIQKPTYGKMYSLNEESLEKIITENIYQDVIEKIRQSINSIKIVDYFPKEIVENFEFEYIGKPNIGTVTEKIENNSITWKIEKLNAQEIATLKYKLKIKDMNNKELLNKTIATNEKVVLTYKGEDKKEYESILTSSPKIKLTEIKEDIIGNNNKNENKDTTIADGKLPQAGTNIAVIITLISIILLTIIIYKKYSNYKDVN